MKLIALKNFRNVGQKVQVENPLHVAQVDKGTVFEIGTALDLKALRKADRESAEYASLLIYSGAAGDANDAKAVKAVQDEIAADKLRDARAVEADRVASETDMGTIATLLGLVKRLKPD
jgi:hypothetical protein